MLALVAFLFVASCYAAPQEMGSHVYEAEGDCFDAFPSITRDYLEGLKKVKKLPENPTRDFKCFITCVGKKIEAMSANGEFDFDTLKEITVLITGGEATHDDAHKMVSNCFDVEHDDDCEKAWKYIECKIEELKPYKFSKGFCPTCHE
uniref:Odorant-binding protein n=1 Tax=Phenacoccus solenopsis TaxID=483260 RepID=A0A0U2V8C5_9HEMI|nr:odorant-binding protein [Phenacoccus solenopsis]